MRHLGDLVPYACTLNEPNLGALLHEVLGLPDPRRRRLAGPPRPPPCRSRPTGSSRCSTRPARGRSRSPARRTGSRVEAIKGVRAETQVGLTVAMSAWEARARRRGDARAAAPASSEDVFLEDVEGDFIGVQNYSGSASARTARSSRRPDVERTQMGYAFQPEALEHAIRRAAELTGLPVIVTENGIGTDDDARRVEFIERALRGVEACLRDGVDVRGYLYWSLLDNFEWAFGYRPTFGLVAVDRATQDRTVKPSARRSARSPARTPWAELSPRRARRHRPCARCAA